MRKSKRPTKKYDFIVKVVSNRGSFSYLISASSQEEAERKAKNEHGRENVTFSVTPVNK
jgi:hypothetical protein